MMQKLIVSRSDYKHFLAIPTRWMDNDVYGHVNNVNYYSFFDTAINEYLITEWCKPRKLQTTRCKIWLTFR